MPCLTPGRALRNHVHDREAGLDGLAEGLLANPALDPDQEAARFIKPAFQTPDGDNPGARSRIAQGVGAA